MTLPSSGSISTAQIQAEIGVAGSLTIPDANTRTLTGKSTGALVIPTDFYGKTWDTGGGGGGTTYVPAPGTINAEDWDSVTTTVTASVSVSWSWSATDNTGLTSSHVSGTSGTDITFTYAPTMGQFIQSKSTTVTLTSGGNTWTINMVCDNSNFNPGSTMSL